MSFFPHSFWEYHQQQLWTFKLQKWLEMSSLRHSHFWRHSSTVAQTKWTEQTRGEEVKRRDQWTVVDFRWCRSEEEQRVNNLSYFLDGHFWTSLFSHQLHRRGRPPAEDHRSITACTHQGTVDGQSISPGVDSSYRHLRSKGAAKTIKKNPSDSDP